MASEESPKPVEVLLRAFRESYSGLPLDIPPRDPRTTEEGHRRFKYSDVEAGWKISGVADIRGDAPRIMSLDVSALDPTGEVTAGLVRDVPVGKIAASLRDLLTLEQVDSDESTFAQVFQLFEGDEGQSLPRFIAGLVDESSKRPPSTPGKAARRAQMSNVLLKQVAEAYLEETADGKPPRPLARLAERFARPEETIRTWVARARKNGWLGPGTRGRAGAEPGPLLIASRVGEDMVFRGGDGHYWLAQAKGDTPGPTGDEGP